jgi:hypothetical protein
VQDKYLIPQGMSLILQPNMSSISTWNSWTTMMIVYSFESGDCVTDEYVDDDSRMS